MGNSDPLILKFFITVLSRIYNLDKKKFRYELHLRADQNPVALKRYWSKQLGIPVSHFKYASIDKRTKGTRTYPEYKGVCLIRCSNVAIQRKSVYLSRKFCEKVINESRA